MESHVLNTYHQARFRNIGHKRLKSISDSSASESSCTQNSPEYAQNQPAYTQNLQCSRIRQPYVQKLKETGQYYNHNRQARFDNSDEDDSDIEIVTITPTEIEVSSDEEAQIEVVENHCSINGTVGHNNYLCDAEVTDISEDQITEITVNNLMPEMEDTSLVEGTDYEIIHVYKIDPDLNVEVSSDEEEEQNCSNGDEIDVVRIEHNQSVDKTLNNFNLNIDSPVISNVDEYFIKETKDEQILEIKDGPVVNDVDEYFIQNTSEKYVNPIQIDVDDFFNKPKSTVDVLPVNINSVPVSNDNAFFVQSSKVIAKPEEDVSGGIKSVLNVDEYFVQPPTVKHIENVADVSQESDIEAQIQRQKVIEDIKQFLLEDPLETSCKTKAQKSCSFPPSPMRSFSPIDIDMKASLTFEDLDIDVSDLSFENYKEKSFSIANKNDDIPLALTDEDVNSFLITDEKSALQTTNIHGDDLSQPDMEFETPVESIICVDNQHTSTPLPKSNVLDFCIEKPVKKVNDFKPEADDFVDVESCNDTAVHVLEANNVNSLLEQFEATEKLNTKKRKRPEIKVDQRKNGLTNGTRLQDAGVQLTKNKMRKILMPTTSAVIRRSPSPIRSDHDYCSPKKRHNLHNLKGGQSLLKPEVLSSNNRILNSRHRSCKDKKVVYQLSSDEESDKCQKIKSVIRSEDSDVKSKKLKQSNKPIPISRKKLSPSHNVVDTGKEQSGRPVQLCRKKLSPPHSVMDPSKDNNSVIAKNAFKASDKCSQPSNGSIKLTIINKSEVILNCDHKDSQKTNEKSKSSSVNVKTGCSVKIKTEKSIKDLDSNKCKIVNSKDVIINSVSIKEECPKEDSKLDKGDSFYAALFTNAQDVEMPQSIQSKTAKKSFEEEMKTITDVVIKKEHEHPTKKRKLNLREYKLRREASNSNNSSATVSPEAIFPDVNLFDKNPIVNKTPPNGSSIKQESVEVPKKMFDPIREASRKILMQSKKQKAMRMRDEEDNVMKKIPKIELSQLKALMKDDMLNIDGTAPAETLPVPIETEKPKLPVNYEEIILVSIGTNTDENVFRQIEKSVDKRKSTSPAVDSKTVINFKIKKSDHILKQNVFDSIKRNKRSQVNDKQPEIKIDKERYKDITATLKSVGKQVNTKISSSSLFASIQDVVMKKAPKDVQKPANVERRSKLSSPHEKSDSNKYIKVSIVREYDVNTQHGEDKIILHLDKKRIRPDTSNSIVQTNSISVLDLPVLTEKTATKHPKEPQTNRERNDSDMSLSSDNSPVHQKVKSMKTEVNTTEKKMSEKELHSKEKLSHSKEKRSRSHEKRSRSKEKRSRSKEKRSHSRERYRRRSRSQSRSRRRRSRTRSRRSRSIDCYNRYKRSKSPYKRNRRLRSPYRSRRTPPVKRDSRPNRSRSKSRHIDRSREKSKSPISNRAKTSPHTDTEKKLSPLRGSFTPPLRKPTVSESSSSSSCSSSTSSSSSSSSSSTSQESQTSRRSTTYKNDPVWKKEYRNSYSSDDRESNTPVEERRIVFVGKLEKEINKAALRSKFSKFGYIMEVRINKKDDGNRYGFVTFQRAHDAWTAVESAKQFPQYDVGFGGRRAFCRQTYADLDGLKAEYTERQPALPSRRSDDMSFEQMLLDMKKKLSQRKNDNKRADDAKP